MSEQTDVVKSNNLSPGAQLFVGTSNVVLPGPKHSFAKEFQSLSRLGYYSRIFNSVEINSTFYKLPRRTTLERWVEETTASFVFTLKLPRTITHQKRLSFDRAAIDEFMELSEAVLDKKGCLLVQFPASITEEYFDTVELILKRISIKNKSQWLVFVEFRHDSWYADHVYTMLKSQKASLVMHDKRESKTPIAKTLTQAVYLRFHGPQGNYRGTYSKEALTHYAVNIRAWMNEGKKVYVYFNNTMGTAFHDAQILKSLCE